MYTDDSDHRGESYSQEQSTYPPGSDTGYSARFPAEHCFHWEGYTATGCRRKAWWVSQISRLFPHTLLDTRRSCWVSSVQVNNSRKGCPGPIACSIQGHVIVDLCVHRPRCIRPRGMRSSAVWHWRRVTQRVSQTLCRPSSRADELQKLSLSEVAGEFSFTVLAYRFANGFSTSTAHLLQNTSTKSTMNF